MSVCASQAQFNEAVDEAVHYVRKKEEEKKLTPAQMIWVLIYLLVIVWALLLAFQAPAASRVVHITLALVFAPAYILAYYTGSME